MEQRKYLEASKKALNWLLGLLQEDGSFQGMPHDLACYYKAPTLLLQLGKIVEANAVLDHIARNFLQADGDLCTATNKNSDNGAFTEFWSYTNGWVAMAAQRLGRFDISLPLWSYLQQYQTAKGNWKTHRQPGTDATTDVLTAAHMGLSALYFGALDKAIAAGRYLAVMAERQPGAGLFNIDADVRRYTM